MSSRRQAVAAGLLSLLAAGAAWGTDLKVLPPATRTFSSPSGTYLLEVRGAPGWKSPIAQAELFATSAGGRRSLWSKTLPHRFGPAHARISDQGQVLLIDEWMKTPSPYALLEIGPSGAEIARYSFANIATVAGVPSSKLVTTARNSVWMSADPMTVPSRHAVILEAGGVRLELDLDTGRLTRAGN